MEYRIIKNPSKSTMEILVRRMGAGQTEFPVQADAVGLVQGRLIDMVVAADIAEKAVGVIVEDIKGSCPQNMIMIAIFGDTASVESALRNIRDAEEKSTYSI